MGLPTVDKFLCCCDLKTGTLIIGVFNLIAAIILAIISLFFLGTTIFAAVVVNTSWSSSFSLGNHTEAWGGSGKDTDLHGALTDLANTFQNVGSDGQNLGQDLQNAANDLQNAQTGTNVALGFGIAMTAVLCLICLGYVIVASMLIHGARKSKPGLLMPWIILTVISLIYDIVRIIGYFAAGDFGNGGSSIIGLVIGIYLFICVWSFRKQLQGELGAVPVPKA